MSSPSGRRRIADRLCRRYWHGNGQTLPVEVLEKAGFPREISVASAAEPANRKFATNAQAPHVVGNAARQPLDAICVLTPQPQCFPSHRRHPPTRLGLTLK